MTNEERAALAKALEHWPTEWQALLDLNGEWTGEWQGMSDTPDADIVNGSLCSDYPVEFAKFIAQLVNAAPGLLADLATAQARIAELEASLRALAGEP